MKQNFPNGSAASIPGGSDFGINFLISQQTNDSSSGRNWGSSNGLNKGVVIATAGTVSVLKVKLDSAVAQTHTFTIYKNGSATALTCTIAAGSTQGADTTHSFAVAAGDLVDIRSPQTTADGVVVRYSIRFTGSTANEAIMSASDSIEITNGLPTSSPFTYFNNINSGNMSSWETQEERHRFYCPMSGVIKSFYFNAANTSPGNTGQWQLSIYKNGVQEASSVITYTSAQSGIKSVTGLSISFVAGDYLQICLATSGTFGNTPNTPPSWGIMYNPAVDGEMMIGGHTSVAALLSASQNSVEYGFLNGALDITATENSAKQLIGEPLIVKKFRVDLATAPGTSQARQFKIRKNGADGNSSITISGTNTSGSDSTHTDSFVDGDMVNISAVATSGSASATQAFWSAVLFIPTDAPVITVLGANPLTVGLGDIYTDPGASAVDSLGTSISVTTGGDTVNTAVAGTYIVTYDAVDSFGNAAVQKTRTVYVLTAPLVNASNVFLSFADSDGNVQLFNGGFSDSGTPIYYELETQELDFGNRANNKKIKDKLVVFSENASNGKIQIIPDEKDPIKIDIDLGQRVNAATLPVIEAHFTTLRWSGNSNNKSPILEGFYFNNIDDTTILNG